MSKTLQQEIANGITQKFKDAVVKKIDKDNYLDIHLPSVHPKKGTHLGINTAKGEIKIVFYCREDDFNTLALNKSKKIEEYAQGLRIKGNPAFNDASKAIEAAIDFVLELMRVNGNTSKTEATETKTKVAVPKKAAPKKAAKKKDLKPIEEDEPEEISGENDDENNEEDSGELNDLFSKILGGNFTVNFVTNRPDLISAVADKGDLNEVKKIIKEGQTEIDVRDSGEDAYTAVHFAAWDGKVEILKYLIKSGADPDIVGNDGRTALHLAAVLGHFEAVEALLKAGVDIEKRIPNGNKYFSKDGATALRDALISQRWEVVEMLIDAGADISCLNEPCKEALRGKKDLFDVIRLLDEDGEYSDGLFDDEKLEELENKVKGIEEEEIEEDEEESDDIEESDLSDFDVNEDSVIKYICDKIKREKYLTNLLYVNQALDSKGYAIDRHQAYFFDSNVLISDNEKQGFLVVNMDGFYSNCVNEEEMQMIFSWSGANDLEYQEDGDGCSIDIIADQGRLTIKKEGSHSLKILYTFYKHVWKAINDKFKDEPFIVWNDVWKMGIKEVGFAEFLDYYTFDVTPNEADVEEEEIEEEEIENDESDEDTADDFSFAEGKPYQKYFNRFLEIANKTGIHINDITVEPNNIERDELWEITRAFAERIYQLDNDKNADQNELDFLCFYAIVSLHWCDIFNQSDKRYSYLNGRFRRDTVALAICFFARIDREFKYYDFIKASMVKPHMQFSVLMWSINTIINNNQDTLFGLFNPKQAEQANELFKQLTRKNGGADPINPNDAPENHPLRSIWWEVYRQFNNVRIPYQFIKSYISQIPPKRSFVQNLFGSKSDVKPGMNVSLLDEDRIKNIAYLEKQMLHKQFPDDWVFINDLAFVSIYFATTTDGQLSAVEKNIIYNLVGEWITEEDENKKQQKVADAFTKAKAEFDKDKSHERFEFALENIRRNFYVNYEYDEEKTHNQLKFVFNDLVAIANADDDETASEVELLKSIMEEWEIEMSEVASDDGEEEDTDDDSEEDEEERKLNQLLTKYGVDSESDLTSITLEQAKELGDCKVDLNLEGLTSLNEQIARILSKHEGDLYLDGLTKISDKVIDILSAFKGGCLSLGGIESLSDKTLEVLAKHEGGQLNLPGLTVVSDRAFEMLSKHNGTLNLNGITSLSEKAAQSLSKLNGALMLNGVTALSDKAAEFLSKHKGLYLSLDGLNSISDNALLFISKYEGDYLYLNALTSLSDRVALALAKYKGELSLNGLTSLSEKAAEALAVKGIKIEEDDENEETDDVNIDDSEIKINDTHVEFFLYLTMGKTDDDLSDDEISTIINFLVEKYKNQVNRNIIEKIFDESFKWWLDSLKNGIVYDELNKNLNLLDEFSSNEKLVVIKNLKKISLLDKNKATKDENELIQVLNKRWGI